MIHHEKHRVRAQIMSNLQKQPARRQESQRQAPGQYRCRREEGKPSSDEVGGLSIGGVVGYYELDIGEPGPRQRPQIAGCVIDSRAPVAKQPMAFDFHTNHSVRAEEGLQGCRIPETGAADVAKFAACRPAHARLAPATVQDIEIFVVIHTGRGVHPLLELHLVTIAQRGYSLRLLDVCAAKFSGGCFLKRTARPAYALRNGIPEPVSQGP